MWANQTLANTRESCILLSFLQNSSHFVPCIGGVDTGTRRPAFPFSALSHEKCSSSHRWQTGSAEPYKYDQSWSSSRPPFLRTHTYTPCRSPESCKCFEIVRPVAPDRSSYWCLPELLTESLVSDSDWVQVVAVLSFGIDVIRRPVSCNPGVFPNV